MRVPEDVVVEILVFIQPRLIVDLESNVVRRSLDSAKEYRNDLKSFKNLRLTSREMNAIVTPFFYRETLIHLAAPPSLIGLGDMFSAGAQYIRHLVIDGRNFERPYIKHDQYWRENQPDRQDLIQAIGDGLARCSKLRRLDALGDHGLFPYRQWLKSPRAQLPHLVSLTYASLRGIGLIHCLVGIGPQLESLVIQGENCDIVQPDFGLNFNLLPRLAKLESLHLYGRLSNKRELEKLFSRLHVKAGTPSKANLRTSPLRHLIITGYSQAEPSSPLLDGSALLIAQVISPIVGHHLTVLHYLPAKLVVVLPSWIYQRPTTGVHMHDILRTVSRICPNLITLSVPCARLCYSLDCLPLRLRHFQVVITRPQTPIPYLLKRHVEFMQANVEAPPRRSLSTLSIFSVAVDQYFDAKWEAARLMIAPGLSIKTNFVTHRYLKGRQGYKYLT